MALEHVQQDKVQQTVTGFGKNEISVASKNTGFMQGRKVMTFKDKDEVALLARVTECLITGMAGSAIILSSTLFANSAITEFSKRNLGTGIVFALPTIVLGLFGLQFIEASLKRLNEIASGKLEVDTEVSKASI